MKLISALAGLATAVVATAGIAASDLPDLGGQTVVVVTENAYPPLQFIEPGSGDAIGWEYDAMAEIGKRLNAKIEYQNISWDAMIPAVSEGQYDLGMTGITIREDRAKVVDFSDAYMRSEMVMMVRGDESRFNDAASFAANDDLLMAAQPGTTPFYVGVYDVLDGNEQNSRIKLFEAFGAGVQALKAGDVDLVLTDGTAGNGYVAASDGGLKIVGEKLGTVGFWFHLPQGLCSRWADECRHQVDERRRDNRRAEQEVVSGLQAWRLIVARQNPAPVWRRPALQDPGCCMSQCRGLTRRLAGAGARPRDPGRERGSRLSLVAGLHGTAGGIFSFPRHRG